MGNAEPRKDEVLITPYRDGPLLIRGPVRLVDMHGRTIESDRDPVALCRCGKSRIRPLERQLEILVGKGVGDGRRLSEGRWTSWTRSASSARLISPRGRGRLGMLMRYPRG